MNAATVVRFVFTLDSTENCYGVEHAWLSHIDGLEAPLKCRVLLNVRAILIKRSGANGAQLATTERRLEQLPGAWASRVGAGADDGVDLINEQNDPAVGGAHFANDCFESLFKLALKLCTGEQLSNIKSDDLDVLHLFGAIAVDNSLREPFHYCGLTNAGFANKHRVIFGAAAQHLHAAANFLIASDHRIQLAGAGALGQVDAVFLEGLHRVLSVRVVHVCNPACGADLLYCFR